MKLAAMVTLYNPEKENINHVKDYIEEVDVVYLIDNSSKDNSQLIPKNKKIRYIANLENLGIASALNQAANLAIEAGYEWLLTMDQDSRLEKSALKKMKAYIDENIVSDVGIISPYHNVETNVKKNDVEIEERVEVMTSGNLLNLDLFKKVGGFKDWLFIDSVDIEYCFNLRKNGYKVLRMNNVIMQHQLGNTRVHKILWKRFICSYHNATRRYYMVRNMLYVTKMYRKYFPGYCRYLKRVQRGQVRYILLFENDKLNKLKMMFKGFRDYKKGIKGRLER